MTNTLRPATDLTPPPPTMASPHWWGADSTRFRARVAGGNSVFVKKHTEHAQEYLHIDSAVAATRAAGEAGLGPLLVEVVGGSDTLVLEDLTDTHSTATMADFHHVSVLTEYLAARRKVHELDIPDLRAHSVFDDVRKLYRRLSSVRAELPADIEWMHRQVLHIEELIASLGADTVPIHGDANCSNAALHRTDGTVLLYDFDWAAKADPLQDVGSCLLEFGLTEYEGRDVFELSWGSFDEGLYCRARLYAAAEALRGGLLGTWVDFVHPGTHEYSKFSDWMFLRARMALSAQVNDDYLRRVR